MHGRREGAAWTLAFVPRAPALADLIGVLEGFESAGHFGIDLHEHF